MPLYLVRWPDFSAAFVNARDEDDLVDQLDMLGHPGGCKWKVYRGPLHIEMDLPLEVQDKPDKRPGQPLEQMYSVGDPPEEEFSHYSLRLSVPGKGEVG
jgi:hypothetical protein